MGADLFGQREETFYYGMYRAMVVGTTDPLKAGRIQARVYPMFYAVEDSDLPWAVPASPLFSGAGNNKGSFMVPDVGTYVFVFFEAGRITQPVYFAEAQTATLGIPTESLVNYPHRKVLKSGSGILVYIDDSTGEISIQHPSGAHITITSAGKIKIGNQLVDLVGTLSDFLAMFQLAPAPGGELIVDPTSSGARLELLAAFPAAVALLKAKIDALKG